MGATHAGIFYATISIGGREEQGLYTSQSSSRTPYFCCKGRVILLVNGSELVKRLVACGWTISNAADTCFQYAAEGKFSELEAFIRQQELLFDDRREYAV